MNGIPEADGLTGFAPRGKDENQHEGEKVETGFPQRTRLFFLRYRKRCSLLFPRVFFFSKYQGHQQSDDNGEYDGTKCSADPQFGAQDSGRQDNGQDVDGRTGI